MVYRRAARLSGVNTQNICERERQGTRVFGRGCGCSSRRTQVRQVTE